MATAPQLITLSNGEKLAVGVYDAFLRLQAAARDAGHSLWVSSGYRTHADQVRIFTARFRQQTSGGGPFNDVRYWSGAIYGYPGTTRWVRHSSAGTVAVPGTSMHEKASAIDFGGIPAGGGTALANWLRANGPRFGFSPTGYGFGEAWHYDYTGNPWAGLDPKPFPEDPAEAEEEEEDMSKLKGASYKRASDGATVYLLFNEASGFAVEHTGVSGSYNNELAKHWETGSWPSITESHARVIKEALTRVRASTA